MFVHECFIKDTGIWDVLYLGNIELYFTLINSNLDYLTIWTFQKHIFFYYHIIVVVGVHCDIYKNSNI
jgi:hypothetical protein